MASKEHHAVPMSDYPFTANTKRAKHSAISKKRRVSPWIRWGLPLAIIVIIAAVLGGVLGSRAHNKSAAEASAASESSAAAAANSAQVAIGRFPTATNSQWMVPVYPSTSNAAFSTPTFVSSLSSNSNAWPTDPFAPDSPAPTNVRPDRPRLIAPRHKWDALPDLIRADAYLRAWNDTIFLNVSQYMSLPPVEYHMDGASGILDNAREIKMRVKAFAYVYRLTNSSTVLDRTWAEVSNTFSSSFGPGTDKWNSGHFLDVAEMCSALAIAYDWLYDAWSGDQRRQILDALNTHGLSYGASAYTDSSVTYAWWRTNTAGNWNCVCNAGLTLAALAVLGDDATGNARTILSNTIENAKGNCAQAVSSDGTWAETANYWFFGTMGHAEMASALFTSTGSDYGLLGLGPNVNPANPYFYKTGEFHMAVFGTTSLFAFGDHGPNKFSSTANSMLLYGSTLNEPSYVLYQRDRMDAAEPWSMFWYDARVRGAWWNGRALDMNFNDTLDQWVSMRSSWTDQGALSLSMKAGSNSGAAHQNHNDLDAGDFVLDALGTRWAGELGSGDYLAPGYFDGGSQDSDRWKYYRKRTEGQNTIVINKNNQLVSGSPKVTSWGLSEATQGGSTVHNTTVEKGNTAFWVANLSSAYATDNATSVHRGVRLLNGRRQVLIQDEVTSSSSWQWRMHTNASVSISSPNSAALTLDGQTMNIYIVSPSSGVSFSTTAATRFDSDPTPPAPDQANPGVTVLVVEVQAGTTSLGILFSPQWDDGTAELSVDQVKRVGLGEWTLSSHN